MRQDHPGIHRCWKHPGYVYPEDTLTKTTAVKSVTLHRTRKNGLAVPRVSWNHFPPGNSLGGSLVWRLRDLLGGSHGVFSY